MPLPPPTTPPRTLEICVLLRRHGLRHRGSVHKGLLEMIGNVIGGSQVLTWKQTQRVEEAARSLGLPIPPAAPAPAAPAEPRPGITGGGGPDA